MGLHVIREAKVVLILKFLFVVQSLQQTVRESAKSNKSKSYTQYLLKEGIENF